MDADIVFFGHTHIPTDETIGSIRLINPGSCSKYSPVCAVVEIDDKGNVLVNHVKI
jgi:predicted phosphodiesterase